MFVVLKIAYRQLAGLHCYRYAGAESDLSYTHGVSLEPVDTGLLTYGPHRLLYLNEAVLSQSHILVTDVDMALVWKSWSQRRLCRKGCQNGLKPTSPERTDELRFDGPRNTLAPPYHEDKNKKGGDVCRDLDGVSLGLHDTEPFRFCYI